MRPAGRIAGLWCSLLATLAIGASATIVASASAQQPEYRTCLKAAKAGKPAKYTGGYNNKRCTEVNAEGKGRYALGKVVTPYPFKGKGKAGTFYFHSGAKIVWVLECKRSEDAGVITSPTEGTLNITFENCRAKLPGAKKGLECPTLTVTVESLLVETIPGEAAGVLLYPGFAKAFACEEPVAEELVAFGAMRGFAVASVEGAHKGPVAGFAADPATGAQAISEFYDFAEKAMFGASLQSAVSGSSLEVGLATTQPLGSKEVVVVGS